MRIGQNPEKDNDILKQNYYHRIIIPIYIPYLNGYYEHALKILKASLGSLLASIHDRSAVTLISNNCCSDVVYYLRSLKDKGLVDRLIECRENRGKIDPVIGEVRACYEELITISDSDVLFKKNWISEVEEVFTKIDKCGMVGHFPDPLKYKGFNSTTLLYGLLTKRLSFETTDFYGELADFSNSINQPIEKYLRTKLLTYTENGLKVVVGAHHFSATFRKDFVWRITKKPSLIKYGRYVDHQYLDKVVDKIGYLRVSTRYPVAYHMGNVWEDWMEQQLIFFAENQSFNQPKRVPMSKPTILGLIPYKIRTLLESLFFRTTLESLIFKMIDYFASHRKIE